MKKPILEYAITALVSLLIGIAGTNFYFNSEITQLNVDLTYCQENQTKVGLMGVANGGGTGITCPTGNNSPGCLGIAK